jgi:AcrR family transcriptional regulator
MQSKRPYHHGDLKRALLDAALAIVRSTGSEKFTLREVARRAGVSHNAPYRHFKDKAELLAAVATEGYNHVIEAMAKAMRSEKTAYEKFAKTGEGFLRFALRYPDHFKLIFDAPRRYEYTETNAAGERAFGTLTSAIEQCQAEGILQQGNSRMLALMFLSFVCGNAKLAITNRLPFSEADQVVAFNRFALDALARGLAPGTPQYSPPIENASKKAAGKTGTKKKSTARR